MRLRRITLRVDTATPSCSNRRLRRFRNRLMPDQVSGRDRLLIGKVRLPACVGCVGGWVCRPALTGCRHAHPCRSAAAAPAGAETLAGRGAYGQRYLPAAAVAKAGTAYAVGTRPRSVSLTVARSVARPEASTPTCGYTGLPEAELPSRAVRDRSPVVTTEGYRFASEENNASCRRRYTELLNSSVASTPCRNDDRSIIERATGFDHFSAYGAWLPHVLRRCAGHVTGGASGGVSSTVHG